jgi:hypothetical protein
VQNTIFGRRTPRGIAHRRLAPEGSPPGDA